MQAYFTRLRNVIGDDGERGRRSGGDEIVVVDYEVQVRPAPPATGPELAGSDPGRREAGSELASEERGVLAGRDGVAGVGADLVVGNDFKQTAAVIDEHEPDLVGAVAAGQAAHQGTQEHGLAGAGIAEYDQVRVGR